MKEEGGKRTEGARAEGVEQADVIQHRHLRDALGLQGFCQADLADLSEDSGKS